MQQLVKEIEMEVAGEWATEAQSEEMYARQGNSSCPEAALHLCPGR